MKRHALKNFMFMILISIFSLLCIALTSSWSVEKYPTRSVELACGQTAGGGVDIFNRIMTKYFESILVFPLFRSINRDPLRCRPLST